MEETGNDYVKINTELLITHRNTHTYVNILDAKAGREGHGISVKKVQ